jgi:hypothetical protein
VRNRKFKTWSPIIWLLISTTAGGAPLFGGDDVLELELHGPLREVTNSRRDREERTFELVAGEDVLSVEVRVRGHSRVKLCDFPPLRLDFRNSNVEGTVFSGQSKLKLVSHCKARSAYEDNVLEEYAAYRIFSLLSDYALDARLLRVRYFDTTRPGKDPVERYAILIESLDALAERTGGVLLQREALAKGAMDLEQLATVFVYQYLIGNTDWSLVTARGEELCCHNGELLDREGRVFYVPYDFDFAGLVNARYAKPLPEMRIRTVKTRRYRGYCFEGIDLKAAILRTLDQEAAILEFLRSLPAVEPDAGTERVRYVERFFEEARDVDGLVRNFEQSCIG